MNKKINHIHERALRLVYNDYTTSFIELFKRDNSVCIHHRNIQKVAIEMFKVKHDLCPEILQTIFCQISSRTKSKAVFHRPNVKSVYNGEQSLRYFGPIVWDTMVPEGIKKISDLYNFKKEITAWVPDNCQCRLCKDFIQGVGFVTLYE